MFISYTLKSLRKFVLIRHMTNIFNQRVFLQGVHANCQSVHYRLSEKRGVVQGQKNTILLSKLHLWAKPGDFRVSTTPQPALEIPSF
jgi:hypothetical protein